jgi:hypothetical protein
MIKQNNNNKPMFQFAENVKELAGNEEMEFILKEVLARVGDKHGTEASLPVTDGASGSQLYTAIYPNPKKRLRLEN